MWWLWQTGYGYINSGLALETNNKVLGYKVTSFAEKPDAKQAKQYLSSGDYFWNSGMFALSAITYINELKIHNPALLAQCKRAWQRKKHEWEFIFPNEDSFKKIEDVSIDYAVMEHTNNAAMVSLDAGWSDLGSWRTLLNLQASQEQNNQQNSNPLVVPVNSNNCHVKSTSDKIIGLVGVNDLLVADTQDALLITSPESSQDVGLLIKQLEKLRPESIEKHNLTYRAWGWHKVLARTDNCQINQMQVKVGSRLSFRKHEHNSEHWTVTSGCATVKWQENGAETSHQISSHESYFIPSGTAYKLANTGNQVLNIIEVQIGNKKNLNNDFIRLNDEDS